MMRFRSLVLASGYLLISSGVVNAQAPSADTKAILDALQGINSRLDAMDQRIEKIEDADEGTASAAPEPTQSAAPDVTAANAVDDPSATPPGMVIQPGWLIGVLPFVENDPEPDPILFFPYSKNALTLNEHMKYTSSENWIRYKGEAKFNAYKTGRYQFIIQITAGPQRARTQGIGCWGYFKVNGDDIFLIGGKDESISIPSPRSQSFSGAVDLDEGSYDLSFRVSCIPNNWGNMQPARQYFTGNYDQMWRDTKIELTLRAPNDLAPRPFSSKELFYFSPENADIQSGSAVISAGDTRSLTSSVNVRRTASTSAAVAAKLSPGDALEIVSLTPDQEWAEVSMNGRRLGFVKVTALNANSQ